MGYLLGALFVGSAVLCGSGVGAVILERRWLGALLFVLGCWALSLVYLLPAP